MCPSPIAGHDSLLINDLSPANGSTRKEGGGRLECIRRAEVHSGIRMQLETSPLTFPSQQFLEV